jgi:hypothetical protein
MARANARACHGSANTGSGWLKILVPQVDTDDVSCDGVLSPELLRGKPH